jgi:hypothetical protein
MFSNAGLPKCLGIEPQPAAVLFVIVKRNCKKEWK